MTAQRAEITMPDWPAAMRTATLRAYLDCRSDSDFAREMERLRAKGYPGADPVLKRHIRAIVDRYLSDTVQVDPHEEAALRAIGR